MAFSPPTTVLSNLPDFTIQTQTTYYYQNPLTTRFVPPASCFANDFTFGTRVEQDQSYGGPPYGSVLVYRGARPECYPEGFSASLTSTSSRYGVAYTSYFNTFSPGVCPESYSAQQQRFVGQKTSQTCCPFEMQLFTRRGSSGVWCASEFYPFTTESPTTETTAVPYGTAVQAYPIVVAWDSSDLSVLPLTTTTATTSTMSSTSRVPTSSPTQEASPALSAGAKAGIGGGVALGGVIMVGVLWVALWRRHKRRRAAALSATEGSDHAKAELSGAGKTQPELDGQKDPAEVDVTARAELDAGWRGWEAPAASGR